MASATPGGIWFPESGDPVRGPVPELPAVGRESGVIGRRVPASGVFALASAAPGLVTGDNGDVVANSVLAVHLEILGVRDDLLYAATQNQHNAGLWGRATREQHGQNGTARHPTARLLK